MHMNLQTFVGPKHQMFSFLTFLNSQVLLSYKPFFLIKSCLYFCAKCVIEVIPVLGPCLEKIENVMLKMHGTKNYYLYASAQISHLYLDSQNFP